MDCNAVSVEHLEYAGDLGGDRAVRLTLLDPRPDRPVRGSYFYTRYLEDIPLTGEFTGPRSLRLVEHDEAGTPRGRFELEFAERDPRGLFRADGLEREVLVGHWLGVDGARPSPVYLAMTAAVHFDPAQGRYAVAGATDDQLVERNVQAFRSAVIMGDRSRVAELVAYPVRLTLGGSSRVAADAREFLGGYDNLFSPELVDQVRAGVPHAMFANSSGIMLGDGVVWFDAEGRVKAINN